MARGALVRWRLTQRVWARWQWMRMSLGKPQTIGAPTPNDEPVRVVSMRRARPRIPMDKVRVYERLPKEESRLGVRVIVRAGLLLNRLLPPMAEGLPEIDADDRAALDFGLTAPYREVFRVPALPECFEGAGPAALGTLAVRGPYALLLSRGDDGRLQWDLRALGEFEHHPGLRSLGLRVVFEETGEGRRLSATEIDSVSYGVVRAGDPEWGAATRLAVCAATTHVSLTRHFNYVHLISGNHWDVASRNHLPSTHPVYRLVWPHLFNSLYTNHGVTRVQLLPDGDFVNMFSFTHAGLMALFDAMYERYDIRVTDPELDWARRGLAGSTFDCPTQENLVELFDVMVAHAQRYLHAYYDSNDALQADRDVAAWLEGLRALIPNGLHPALAGSLTRDGLARAIGAYLYEGNTIHDLAGTTLWDYQLWPSRNPTRVREDGRRVAIDVFQRVINNNFALQLRRAPLLADYGAVALDATGRSLFTQLYEDCRALQRRYDQSAAGPWRMEPKNLELNMNG